MSVATAAPAGVTPAIQAVLARSFEYYSGVVIGLECDGRAVGAGGRYDELVGLVGGRAVPASGFALYASRLAELLTDHARPPRDRILVLADGAAPELVALAHRAAAELRGHGLHVESIEGSETAATHRLVCRAGTPSFTLTWPDGQEQSFERLEDVARVLEHDR